MSRGETIEVGVLAGTEDEENVSRLEPGQDVVLFLSWFETLDVWEPMASDSGIFDVIEDSAVARGEVGPLAGIQMEIEVLKAEVGLSLRG